MNEAEPYNTYDCVVVDGGAGFAATVIKLLARSDVKDIAVLQLPEWPYFEENFSRDEYNAAIADTLTVIRGHVHFLDAGQCLIKLRDGREIRYKRLVLSLV